MKLSYLKIANHPILEDVNLSFINPKTNRPYQIVAFVGENGCGKTTLLNELFNYDESTFIINKENKPTKNNKKINPIFIRQNSIYTISQNELVKKINGKFGPFPISPDIDSLIDNDISSIDKNRFISTCKDLIPLLKDDVILSVILNNRLSNIKCGGEALKLIDGSKSDVDLSKMSSGEKEVLIKLNILQSICEKTDYVLFDEPETSLHPRWQKIIIKLFQYVIYLSKKDKPQMFIATHSEKILESLLKMDDVLLIHLYKERGQIKNEIISNDILLLPTTSFSEINYIVFKIPSFEYNNELYSYLGEITNKDRIKDIDNIILHSSFYKSNRRIYFKKWEQKLFDKSGQHEKIVNYSTLPTYIRNYSHHPHESKMPPIDEELEYSIELLRKLIINLNKK